MTTTETDYSKLVLTEEEQTIFDRFKKSYTATLTRKEYHILRGKNLIIASMNGEDPFFSDDIQSGVCKLSQRGKEFRAYQDGLRKAENKARFRFWIPIVISIVSLIVSILRS